MRYIVRKLAFYLVAAWAALTINFFLPQLIPGNPVEALIGRMSQSGTVPPGRSQGPGQPARPGHREHLPEVRAVP